ncbi:MAG: SagB/ThcOx family dehydrogenase [Alphaproteobacteria bacterium]|nr:SagB/ThcOx family dehydrogenase [Alphaproteobacteria bacterium]MBV9372326.1 SagB/ThcOx family dehydrogenase [Alphaproteobacteria bacterium]MBV9899618.1 SagB/ThcOx family dehydrogenase [Alphaproteobacteria bacterium]
MPLLSIRPSSGRQIVFSDALNRRRAAVDSNVLLEHLAARYRGSPSGDGSRKLADKLAELGWFPPAPVEAGVVDRIAHWWNRGWTSSLRYYLWSRGRPQVDAKDSTGEVRRAVITGYLNESEAPARPSFDSLPVVELPEPSPLPEDVTVGQALMARRSVRAYARHPAPAQVLSSVLWNGLANVRQRQQRIPKTPIDYLRSYGIAFDLHVAVFDVESIEPGIYRYDMVDHRLLRQRAGDYREEVTSILVGMQSPMTASWTLVISADIPRYQWRYRHEHALRNLYIGSGRVAQLLILLAQAYGFGSVPTPAMHDTTCCELFGMDPASEVPLYTITTGPISSARLPEVQHA